MSASEDNGAGAATFWIWRALDRLIARLRRFGNAIDWLPATFFVVKRMRFPLLFAIAAVFALRTEQGREVIVNSFDSTAQGVIFVVFCALAAASVWYTSRLLLYTWQQNEPAGQSEYARRWSRWLRMWLPGMLGMTVLLIPAVGILSVQDRIRPDLLAGPRWFAGLLLALCALFLLALLKRHKLLASVGFSTDRTGMSYWQLGRPAGLFFASMLGLNLLAIVVFACFPLLPVHLGLGSGVVVMLATGLAIVTGSIVSHISDESRLPILSGLFFAAVVFSLWNDNHRVTTIADRDDSRLTEDDKDALSAPHGRSFDAYLKAKLEPRIEARKRECGGQPVAECDPRVPFVVVAAEGGGVRAAAWTALVLSKIDRSAQRAYGDNAFPDHLVAISGVSGGSLGGALYVAARAEGVADTWTLGRRFFDADLLTPTLANMLFVDTPMRFLPFAISNRVVPDRGVTFERTIERAWSEALGAARRDEPGANVFARPSDALWRQGTLPLLIANATIVASGKRMLQSPVTLRESTAQSQAAAEIRSAEQKGEPSGHDVSRDDRSFVGASDGNDCLLPGGDANTAFARLGMPLSAMVHNSARFTWVSPAGRYGRDSACKGVRVVDGGYFENSGTSTADDIVWAVQHEYPDQVRTIVVQIRNEPLDPVDYRADCEYPRAAKAEDRVGPRFVLTEVLDPVLALFNGRTARADQAKLGMKRRICPGPKAGDRGSPAATAAQLGEDHKRGCGDACRRDGRDGAFIEFALLKDPKAAFPLHWAISDHTLRRMEAQFDDPKAPNRKALDALIAAMRQPPPFNSADSAARTVSSPH